MASSSSSSSSTASGTPKLIISDDKSNSKTSVSRPSPTASIPSTTVIPPGSGTATKKLTKILSTQTSVDRHHPSHPVTKRFSIDADPSSIILNTPVTDLSNHPSQHPPTPDADEHPSIHCSSTGIIGKEPSPVRSPSLKQSDSFLEIPYEKGEIVDLIRLADDPNAEAHITNDGQEVLLEHGAVPQ